MKKNKKWLLAILTGQLFVLLFAGSAFAAKSGTCGTNLSWALDNNNVLTISGTGAMRNFSDSNTINKVPWGTDPETVIIEEGVTSIGDYAFYNCRSLTNITIPESVTSIGDYAFYNCRSLTSITIPEGVTSIGEHALYNCLSLTSITIPESVTSIGRYAFYNCRSLTNITIPEGVTSIGSAAFYGCSNLTSITIPEGVTSIGGNTFYGCSNLTSITISEGVTSIGDWAFNNCSGLTGITIPEGVTSIGDYAFQDCSSLTSITIPESVMSIGKYAFYRCSNLTSITIPEGITSINTYTFYGCNSLTSITIPEGVTSIDDYAFQYCNSLTSITIPEGVTSIGHSAFCSCSNLTNITIPESVTSIGPNAFASCSITSITIPENVTNIESGTFHLCSSLTSVTIPEGVTSIDGYAFADCYSMTSITIPKDVTSIGDYAFRGCSSLTSITIPEGVTSIGDYAFRGCSNLTSITILGEVTSIGDFVFYDCNNLISITILGEITGIGQYTFSQCSAKIYANIDTDVARTFSKKGHTFWIPGTNYELKYIYNNNNDHVLGLWLICNADKSIINCIIPEGVTYIANFAFSGCSSLTSITIPESVTSIGSYAFSGCRSLTSIAIPESVTSLGSYTFSGCSSLTSIAIPVSVTSIESYTFSGCSSLPSITIPESVNSIDSNAFYGCAKLTKVAFLQDSETDVIISNYAFTSVPAPTIYCYEFSSAEGYATDKGWPVVLLDEVDFAEIRTITLGDDFRISCGTSRKLPINIFPDQQEIFWSSSAPETVAVKDGVITALQPGTAMITAEAGGATDTMEITVYTLVDSFGISKAEEWLIAKDTIQLSIVDIMPADAETAFTWSSSDTAIATVNETGLVTTKKPGDVTITATDTETGIKRESLLHVCYPVTEIELNSETLLIEEGQDAQLTANVTTRNQTCINHLVVFSSSDETVATVDQNGKVHGIAEGQAVITATSASGITASIEISVWNVCYTENGTAYEHDWGTAAYEWADDYSTVTATRICLRDSSHIETVTVETIETIVQEPDCVNTGLANYMTKPFRKAGLEVQYRENIELSALGHDWGTVAYTWNDDNTEITATRICSRNAEHTDTETTENIAVFVSISPTEYNAGSSSYRARFERFPARSKAVTIPALKDMATLRLPEDLTVIKEEAFRGGAFQAVVVPNGCTSIEANAFAECPNLLYVWVQGGVSLTDAAFTGSRKVAVDRGSIVAKVGDEGELVRQIQDRLVQLGYLANATGVYNAETETAVGAFQTNNDLNSTGICDQNTIYALFGN